MAEAVTARYRIRRAMDEDLPRVAPMWRRLVEFEASLSPRFAVKPDAEDRWLDELKEDRAASRAEIFLAERVGAAVAPGSRETEIVGFLHVRATRGAPFHEEDRIGFVDGVWVDPDHRRHGLSKALLTEAGNWCRARKLTILEAGVVIANKAALAAWERLGFEMTAATVTRPIHRDPRAAVARAFDAQAPRIAASEYHTLEKRVRRFLEFAKPDAPHRVLDVGCGPGVLLAALKGAVAERVGVEISKEMAARARATGAEVVLAAAEHLPFKDGSFERVITRATLHHLTDPAAGALEMTRVTATGGALVVEDLVASDDPERAERHNELERLRDGAHHRMVSREELHGLAERAGLRVEEALAVRQPRELEAWLAITEPSEENAATIRKLARQYGEHAERDPTGLLMRVVGDEVRFDHTHYLMRAVKPRP